MATTPTTVTYTGSGSVASSDYKTVKYVGKTKGGKAVTIEMTKAICRSNPDWAFNDRDDVVPEIEFEGVYTDSKLAEGTRTEPWTINLAEGLNAGNGEILLGVGKFYVDSTLVGLTRGGGRFVVEREYREINADGDPGAVEDRIEQVEGRPKLTFRALQWVTKIPSFYAGMTTVTTTTPGGG